MDKIIENILDGLIKKGEVVGVACSGGKDSIALLHYLNSIKEKLDFEVVSINIDHSIRDESSSDSKFVADFCKENKIRNYKFTIDSLLIARQKKLSLEDAARQGRYDAFRALIKKGVVDKIALAHHEADQAETILMHIFRGAGLAGASGMKMITDDGEFIRPMLNVSQSQIKQYLLENGLEWVEDKSNADNNFARNNLRNVILPLIEKQWGNAIANICNFGGICAEDDEYINSKVDLDAIIYDEKKNSIKLPKSYFLYHDSIVTRMVRQAFSKLGVEYNIEKKHIDMVKYLAKRAENGAKFSMPNKVLVYSEYDYVTIVRKLVLVKTEQWRFRIGKKKLMGIGSLIVEKSDNLEMEDGYLKIDIDKLPNGIVWRYQKEGDYMLKFGGGTKKINKIFSEKQIPMRLREHYPVLACDNEILVVSGVEISDKLRLDANTKNVARIKLEMEDGE